MRNLSVPASTYLAPLFQSKESTDCAFSKLCSLLKQDFEAGQKLLCLAKFDLALKVLSQTPSWPSGTFGLEPLIQKPRKAFT